MTHTDIAGGTHHGVEDSEEIRVTQHLHDAQLKLDHIIQMSEGNFEKQVKVKRILLHVIAARNMVEAM